MVFTILSNHILVSELITYTWNKLYEISGLSSFTWQGVLEFIAVGIVVFVIELVAVGWEESSIKKLTVFDKSTQNDFAIWLIETFSLFNILAFLFSLETCYYLVGIIQKSIRLDIIAHIQNGYIQFAVVFILSDLKEYIKHLAFHRFGPLWAVHEFHHAASSFTILTAYRFHFLQTSIGMFFDVVPFVLLGAPIQTIIGVVLLRQIHGMLIHSNITHSWGFIGRYILVSPMAHRIHHSVDPKHYNKNFGGTFIFWDRLFGTYSEAMVVPEIGIPNNPYNSKSIFYDWSLPFSRAYRSLVKSKVE